MLLQTIIALFAITLFVAIVLLPIILANLFKSPTLALLYIPLFWLLMFTLIYLDKQINPRDYSENKS